MSEEFNDWSTNLQRIVHLEKAAHNDLLTSRFNSAYEHLLHIEQQSRAARTWILSHMAKKEN